MPLLTIRTLRYTPTYTAITRARSCAHEPTRALLCYRSRPTASWVWQDALRLLKIMFCYGHEVPVGPVYHQLHQHAYRHVHMPTQKNVSNALEEHFRVISVETWLQVLACTPKPAQAYTHDSLVTSLSPRTPAGHPSVDCPNGHRKYAHPGRKLHWPAARSRNIHMSSHLINAHVLRTLTCYR